jgi:hypothetical protein
VLLAAHETVPWLGDFFFFFFFFFFNGPVISTECTAALGLLCCPSITFSTVLITLYYVWRSTGPLD